jgi:uncharacterized membrane protein YbhN (UPF0104 family)
MLRLALFAFAAWALQRELAGLNAGDLLRHGASYGWRHAALALGCTAASFLTLGVIESLALRSAQLPTCISRRFAMFTAFVANATSQTVGLALLTGAAVRLRAYARYQLDVAAVGRVSAFVTLTITLGLLACGATAFIMDGRPLALAGVILPTRSVGLLLGVIVAAYLTWSVVATRDTIGRGRWELRRPSGRLALAQVLVSSADWLLTGTVLFAVLPPAAGIGYLELLRIYLVAQTVGVASHIPGGAGVFEVVVLSLAARGDASQRAALVAGLVMFRVVYYLLPLVAAMVVAAVAELRLRGAQHRGVPLEGDTVTAGADSLVMRVG